jgi:exodeoxyribonuclease VII small subunit
MTDPRPVPELGYAEALAELEAILDRLEHDEPDVDRVAVDVARAAELVQHCRGRIADARLKVEEVVGDLAPEAAPPDATGGADDAEPT